MCTATVLGSRGGFLIISFCYFIFACPIARVVINMWLRMSSLSMLICGKTMDSSKGLGEIFGTIVGKS